MRSEIDDGARQGAGDARHGLDASDDESTEFVHRAGLGSDDDVVRTGNVLRKRYAGDIADGLDNGGSFAYLSLNEDIRLNAHAVTIAAGWSCRLKRQHVGIER